MLVLFNKPFGVVCQFSPSGNHPTLKQFLSSPGIYPVGRLDRESEGLVLLTDNGQLQHRLAHPNYKAIKEYWVQVEGEITASALEALQKPLDLGSFVSLPCIAESVNEPSWLWNRHPAIRSRKSIPTCWIKIQLREGKNHQVRRMTAKIGFPTLRLIRWRIDEWQLSNLLPGEFQICPITPTSSSLHPKK